MKSIRKVHSIRVQDLAPEILPETLPEIIKLYSSIRSSKLQALLTTLYDSNIFDSLLESYSDATDKARLLSASGNGASGWLRAIPTTDATRMNDYQFRFSMRLRLGLEAHPNWHPPENGKCDSCNEPYSTSWHPLECIYDPVDTTHRTYRHNDTVHSIKEFLCKYGINTSKEQQAYHNSIKIIDLVINPLSEYMPITADVSIHHPTASSYIPKSGNLYRGIAANKNERTKITKYQELAMNSCTQFYPITIESYGHMSKRASQLIHKLNDLSENEYHWFRHPWGVRFHEMLQNIISVSVQKGNSMCMRPVIDN